MGDRPARGARVIGAMLALCAAVIASQVPGGCSPSGELGDRGGVEGYVYIPASPTVGALQGPTLCAPIISSYETAPQGCEPLVGAEVRDIDAGLSAVTDSSGRYEILGLLPGTHRLGVTHEGIVDTELTVNVYPGRRTSGCDLPPLSAGQVPAYSYMGLWEVQWQTDDSAGAFHLSVDYSGNLVGGGLWPGAGTFRVTGTCGDRGDLAIDLNGSVTGTGRGRQGEGGALFGVLSLTDPEKVTATFRAARVIKSEET